MTLFELFKNNENRSQGKETMWETIKIISDNIAPLKETNKDWYWELMHEVFGALSKQHYDKDFAEWQVEQMYYIEDGKQKHCPVSLAVGAEVYEKIKNKLKYAYNAYDFYVTWCMIYTDDIMMYKRWWADATDEQLNEKVTEASINYLNDDDCKEGKIWRRFNK